MTLAINGPDWPEGRRPLFLHRRIAEAVPLVESYRALLEAGVTTASEWQSLSGHGCPTFPQDLALLLQSKGEIDARPGQFWIARGERGDAMGGAVVELLSFRSKAGVEEVSVLFWTPLFLGNGVFVLRLSTIRRLDAPKTIFLFAFAVFLDCFASSGVFCSWKVLMLPKSLLNA